MIRLRPITVNTGFYSMTMTTVPAKEVVRPL